MHLREMAVGFVAVWFRREVKLHQVRPSRAQNLEEGDRDVTLVLLLLLQFLRDLPTL